jgi:hypothetical protein
MTSNVRYPILLLVLAAVALACGSLTDPDADPPGVPSGLNAEARSTSSILVTWAAPASGGDVASYEVERALAVGNFQLAGTASGSDLTFTDTGLEGEQRYRYRVRACNGGGCSAFVSGAAANTFGTIDIVTGSLPAGAIGQPYLESVQAINAGDSYEWSVVSGSLPGGLVLDGTAGVISGTPDTEETAQFTLQARAVDGQTAQADYTVDILAALPIEILNIALPPVLVGGEYDVPLRASGGGVSITWSVISGTLPPGLSLDPAGAITGSPTATDTAALTLRAESAGEFDEADFSLAVIQDVPGSFNITPMAVVEVPPTIQPHVDSAIARWERAIIGDLQPALIASDFFGSTSCNGFGEEVNGTTLDDVIVLVNIASIDGPSNTLGFAGPCAIRGGAINLSMPIVGHLTLDSDDLLPITGTQALTDLLFHEIGHVLGFGSLWSYLELVDGADTNQPVYNGAGGKEEYAALGESGDIPLENIGEEGDGSFGVHWRETTFDAEIMTPAVEAIAVFQPLSRMTIASMEDLGYTTNRDEADPYALASMALPDLPADQHGYDIVDTGPFTVLYPDGTVLRDVLRRPER